MITDISFSIAYLRWSKIDTPETSKIGKNFQKIIYMDQIKHLKIIRHESEKRLVDENSRSELIIFFRRGTTKEYSELRSLKLPLEGSFPYWVDSMNEERRKVKKFAGNYIERGKISKIGWNLQNGSRRIA